jgi:hypothetical protein
LTQEAAVFATISDMVPWDRDFPDRTRRLELLRLVLDGSLYTYLPYEFHEERTAGGAYIPLRQRRPSVRYALPRVVVEDSVALLFSEGHFPGIDSADADVRAAAAALARSTRLNSVMTEAALRGSIGSVAILMRVLRGRVFLDVMDTPYLTPEWDPAAPDTLLRVTERVKVSGAALAAQGYDIGNPDSLWWFSRQWDSEAESWFLPMPAGTAWTATIDPARSVRHGLGFVPIVWIRNLPGGDATDGLATFRSAIETSIEIDYQLSQAGRGLKYSSDPTLLIREPAGVDGTMVHGAANALVVSEKGDARLLEIGGTASQAVIDYVRVLRELALESVHGNRADASRLTVPASGRALELMNQGLLWLADNLRISYGENGLLPLMRMMLRAAGVYALDVDGVALPRLDATAPISLRWPDWYPPDAADRQKDAATIVSLVQAGLLSRETALRILAPDYDIADPGQELGRITS